MKNYALQKFDDICLPIKNGAQCLNVHQRKNNNKTEIFNNSECIL